jgi:hypothetical protein
MLKRENTGPKNVVLLASCFFLLSLAQTARPLESIALLSHPGVAAKYPQLTRHTPEEIGGRVTDLSAGATLAFGHLTAKALVRSSCLEQLDVLVARHSPRAQCEDGLRPAPKLASMMRPRSFFA